MMKTLESNADDYSRSGIAPCRASRRVQIPRDCAGQRLDAVLAQLFPELSRSRLAAWLKEGHITVDGANVSPSRKAWGGESIELLVPEGVFETDDKPEAIGLSIVFEDDALIVIDKPVGLVVHPGSGNRSGTLLNALLHHAPQLAEVPRAGIVHRLDKDTSGLLVVAKTLEAQTDLVRQLQARTVKRHYLALVHGKVSKAGAVETSIGRHPTQRTRMAVVNGGREARTHYSVCELFARTTLIECVLDTGRTHQIRVHMASINHPLVGDSTYGKRKSGDPLLDAFPRQALHAWQLGLLHPSSHEAMQWESALPADFVELLNTLRTVEAET
jgi:23S rRNA pseudouridine1911/1915/1917 synthase